MADNAQKTPVGISLNRFARGRALDQIAQTGRALPCVVVKVTGAIVQVAFQVQQPPGATAPSLPNVTIPTAGSEYVRAPIQLGCKGFAVAADAYLGGMSGLGGGIATMAQTGNLTALVFVPIGNANWFSVDGEVLVCYGPNGVTLMDQGQNCILNLTTAGATVSIGAISLAVTGTEVVITSPKVVIHTLPGSPGSSGQLWSNSGTVMVSP